MQVRVLVLKRGHVTSAERVHVTVPAAAPRGDDGGRKKKKTEYTCSRPKVRRSSPSPPISRGPCSRPLRPACTAIPLPRPPRVPSLLRPLCRKNPFLPRLYYHLPPKFLPIRIVHIQLHPLLHPSSQRHQFAYFSPHLNGAATAFLFFSHSPSISLRSLRPRRLPPSLHLPLSLSLHALWVAFHPSRPHRRQNRLPSRLHQ